MTKKLLSIALALMLCLSTAPTAWADEPVAGNEQAGDAAGVNTNAGDGSDSGSKDLFPPDEPEHETGATALPEVSQERQEEIEKANENELLAASEKQMEDMNEEKQEDKQANQLEELNAPQVPVSNEGDILAAIAANSEVDLVLTTHVSLTKRLDIPTGKTVSLQTANNSTFTIAPAASMGALIKVNSRATLSIDGPVVLDNQNTSFANRTAVVVNNGTFTLNHSGSVIENFMSNWKESGAVVCAGDGAKFYMNSGTIQNNKCKNQYAAGGVLVKENGYFEMTGGTIKNNHATTINSGGGVMIRSYKEGATATDYCTTTFVMTGGTIEDNSSYYGGGVYLLGGYVDFSLIVKNCDFYSKATFAMNGGKLINNEATGYSYQSRFYNGGGGAVFVELRSEFAMNGGEISENKAAGVGGGVATSDQFVDYAGDKIPYEYVASPWNKWPTYFPASFTMNGGEIARNEAYSSPGDGDAGCGGGVYSASSSVVLNEGNVSDNYAQSQGGGAYVGSVPYSIELHDLVLKDNEAELLGGGIWLCPTGSVDFFVSRGGAVYDNEATGNPAAGDDIAIVRNIKDAANIKLVNRMLGGGYIQWNKDGEIESNALGSPKNAPRHNPSNPIIETELEGTNLSSKALKSTASDEAKKLATTKAKMTMTGNKSQRGGGIGSNGSVIVGDKGQPSKELIIEKVWENIPDDIDQPIEARVHLEISGFQLDEIVLNEANNWTAHLVGLPADAEIKIVEVSIPGYTASYEWSEESNENLITLKVIVKNSYNVENTPETGQLTVKKLVTGKGDKAREFNFEVLLTDENDVPLTDSFPYTGSHSGSVRSGDVIQLAHNETITITNLPVGTKYKVSEIEANQDGYTTTEQNATGDIVVGQEITALFTNHKRGTEEPPTTPEIEEPPTTPEIEEPPTTPETEEPPTTPGTEEPPTTPGTEEPPTTPQTPGTKEPPTKLPTPETSDLAPTGDNTSLGLWGFVLLLAGLGMFGALIAIRKRDTKSI